MAECRLGCSVHTTITCWALSCPSSLSASSPISALASPTFQGAFSSFSHNARILSVSTASVGLERPICGDNLTAVLQPCPWGACVLTSISTAHWMALPEDPLHHVELKTSAPAPFSFPLVVVPLFSLFWLLEAWGKNSRVNLDFLWSSSVWLNSFWLCF